MGTVRSKLFQWPNASEKTLKEVSHGHQENSNSTLNHDEEQPKAGPVETDAKEFVDSNNLKPTPDNTDVNQPTDTVEVKSLSDTEEVKPPPDYKEVKLPSDTEEVEPPPDYTEVKLPSDTEEEKLPPDNTEVKLPSDTEEEKPPPDYTEIKLPSDTEEEKPPPDYTEIKLSSDTEEEKLPPDYTEVKLPSDTEEEKPPPDDKVVTSPAINLLSDRCRSLISKAISLVFVSLLIALFVVCMAAQPTIPSLQYGGTLPDKLTGFMLSTKQHKKYLISGNNTSIEDWCIYGIKPEHVCSIVDPTKNSETYLEIPTLTSYQLQTCGEDLRTTPSISPEKCCRFVIHFLYPMRETITYEVKLAPSRDSPLELEVDQQLQVRADKKGAAENVKFGGQAVAGVKDLRRDDRTLRSEAGYDFHSIVSSAIAQLTRTLSSGKNLAKNEKLQPRNEGNSTSTWFSFNLKRLLIVLLLIAAINYISGAMHIEFPSAQKGMDLPDPVTAQVFIPAKQIRDIERSAVHSVQHSRNNNAFFDTTEVYDKTTQDPAVEPTQLSESSCTQPKSTLASILLGRSAEWQWTQKFKVTLEKPRIVTNDDENETSLLEIAAQDLGSEMELNPGRKCRNAAFTKSTADVEVDIIPNGNRRGCLKCPDSGGDRTGSDEGERSDQSGSNGATASNEVSNVERHPSSGLGAGGSAGGGGDDGHRDEKYYWSSSPEDGDDEAKPRIIVVLQFTVQDESPKKLILSGLQQIFLDPRECREWQEEISYWFNRRNYSFTHMTRREARLHINHWPPHLVPSFVCTIDELQISEEFAVTLSSAISHLPLNRNDRRSADHNVPHQLPRLPVYQNPIGQTNLIFAIYPPPPCNNNRPATAALLGHPDRSPANPGMQLNLRQEISLTDRTSNMTRQLSLPHNSPRNSRATRLRDVDRGINEAFRRLNLTEPSHLLPSAASDIFHPPPVATMRGRRRTQTVDSTWVISEPVDMPCRRPTETNPLIESPLPQRITPYTDHQQRSAFDHSALRERQSQTPRAQPTLPPLSESSISGSSRTPNWPHFPPCHHFTPSKLSLSSSTSYYIQRPSRRHRVLRLYNHQRHSRRRISTQHRSLRRRCHCRYHLTETEPTVTGVGSKQVQEDTLPVEDQDVHGVNAEANGGEPDVAAPPILPVQEENPDADESEPPTRQGRIHHPTDY